MHGDLDTPELKSFPEFEIWAKYNGEPIDNNITDVVEVTEDEIDSIKIWNDDKMLEKIL